jgi:hypothetical protein
MTRNQTATTQQDEAPAIRPLSLDELRMAAGGAVTRVPIKTFLCPST